MSKLSSRTSAYRSTTTLLLLALTAYSIMYVLVDRGTSITTTVQHMVYSYVQEGESINPDHARDHLHLGRGYNIDSLPGKYIGVNLDDVAADFDLRTKTRASIDYTCDTLEYTGKPVFCSSDVTFYTRRDILDNLRSKWLYFAGDSQTRGLVLALMLQLDPEWTHPFNMQTWYNVTDQDGVDEEATWGEHWRGHGGDFARLDYHFRRTASSSSGGEWVISYKKASCLYGFFDSTTNTTTSHNMGRRQLSKTGHYPDVFLPKSTLNHDEVRISFHMARGTDEIRQVWEDKIRRQLGGGIPDVFYANVGPSGGYDRHRVETLRKIQAASRNFILGTKVTDQWSKLHKSVLLMAKDNVVLNRTLCLSTPMRESCQMWGGHYNHIVNSYDVMQLFYILGWKQKEAKTTVEFSPFCSIATHKAEKQQGEELKEKYNITVPLPEQGWKTAWKLPCKYTVH